MRVIFRRCGLLSDGKTEGVADAGVSVGACFVVRE